MQPYIVPGSPNREHLTPVHARGDAANEPRIRRGATDAEWQRAVDLGLTEYLLPVVCADPGELVRLTERSPEDPRKVPSIFTGRMREGRREYRGIQGWTASRTTLAEVATWRGEPDYGLAIQARAVRAIDVDVDESVLAREIEDVIADHLCGIPLPARRRPGSARFLIGLRIEAPLQKRRIVTSAGAIELLADGQQFVACGTHKSGARYKWDSGEIPDFVVVDAAWLDALWADLEQRFGVEPAAVATAPATVHDSRGAIDLDDVVPPAVIDDLRSALGALNAEDYHAWIAIGQALRGLGDTGFGLWASWSATAPNFDADALDAKWASFSGDRTGYRAIFAKAQAAGWKNPRAGVTPSSTSPRVARPERPRFEFVSFAELLAERTPSEYLIGGLIPTESTVLLVGESKAGKSFLAVAWGASIAAGRDWCGRRVRQGATFMLAGEGRSGLLKRADAWAQENSIDQSRFPICFSRGAAALTDPSSAEDVIEAVETLSDTHGRPSLVIVDTLHRNFGSGDENSASDFGRFLSSIDAMRDRLGCTVLVVHHTGHQAPGRGRGSSAIRAAVDAEYLLTTNGERRTLTCTKMKDDAEPAPMHFELKQVVLDGWPRNEDGVLPTSAVLVPADPPPTLPRATRKLGKWGQHVLGALEARVGLDGQGGVPVDDLLTAAAEREPDPGEGKRDRRKENAERALRTLVENGRLTESAGIVRFNVQESADLSVAGTGGGDGDED